MRILLAGLARAPARLPDAEVLAADALDRPRCNAPSWRPPPT
jgi:hypothetical protein